MSLLSLRAIRASRLWISMSVDHLEQASAAVLGLQKVWNSFWYSPSKPLTLMQAVAGKTCSSSSGGRGGGDDGDEKQGRRKQR